MSPESQPNNIPGRSIEVLNQTFKKRLDDILYTPINIENIETFGDKALDDTTTLVGDLLDEYHSNPSLEGNRSLSTQEQEDDVCTKLNLPNIPKILDSIMDVQKRISDLKNKYLKDITTKDTTTEVITPTDPSSEDVIPKEGNGSFKEKDLKPRFLTLLYILETDFNLDISKDVSVLEGQTTDTMMRQTPYMRVTVPLLNRIVYICDEEGNASYVFDIEKLDVSPETLDLYTKDQKNILIKTHPGIGTRIIQSPNWRTNMSEYLSDELPEPTTDGETDEKEKPIQRSEFIKRTFLSFEKFQEEVKAAYFAIPEAERIGVDAWYRYKKEYKKHKGWPSDPYQTYESEGWVGFPELIGLENGKKKEHLSFQNFTEEVRSAYFAIPEAERVGIQVWYKKEYKKHKGWPSDPRITYKNKGWDGWAKIIGRSV